MSYLLDRSTTIRVYTRDDWGAREPRPTLAQPHAPMEAFVHHSAGPGGFSSLDAQKRHVREMQDFHVDSLGWADIGYHFVVFQPVGPIRHARVFEARDWRAVPAAQKGHNTGTLALCVVGDFTRDELKRNTRYAVELVLRRHPAAAALATVGGHRDVAPTVCPGDELYRWIGRIAAASELTVYRAGAARRPA